MISIKVMDEMSSPVVSVDGERTILEAANMMTKHNIGSLIIEIDEVPTGIITERDIVTSVTHNTLKSKLKEKIDRPLITIKQDAPIGDAAQLMMVRKIRHLAVIDKKNEVVGLINIRDVINSVHEGFLALFNS